MDKEKTYNNLPPEIKKFLFIEDGSVDTDDLGERLASNPEIAIVIYRQGSQPPQLVDLKNGGKKQ